MSTAVKIPKRERERADARMERIRVARSALTSAEREFQKAVLAAYERRGPYTVEQVAQAAGWSRPRLYQFLAAERGEPYQP